LGEANAPRAGLQNLPLSRASARAAARQVPGLKELDPAAAARAAQALVLLRYVASARKKASVDAASIGSTPAVLASDAPATGPRE